MLIYLMREFFFFSSRRRHTRLQGDWSSDVCSSDLGDRGHIFYSSEEIRRLDDHACGLVGDSLIESFQIDAAILKIADRGDRNSLILQIGRASCRERV